MWHGYGASIEKGLVTVTSRPTEVTLAPSVKAVLIAISTPRGSVLPLNVERIVLYQ